MDAPIYVVLFSTGGKVTEAQPEGGPIVMETDVDGATLARAQRYAAQHEKHYGPARIGRVVFEDVDGRPL